MCRDSRIEAMVAEAEENRSYVGSVGSGRRGYVVHEG